MKKAHSAAPISSSAEGANGYPKPPAQAGDFGFCHSPENGAGPVLLDFLTVGRYAVSAGISGKTDERITAFEAVLRLSAGQTEHRPRMPEENRKR